jgi:Polyketide cyclase / dehydrase and lipid transport
LRTAEARIAVKLDPDDAFALWADPVRWPAFVEGFGRLASVDRGWPGPGAKAVWDSIAGGRGRVTEQVTERDGARLSTQVFEDALAGTQTFAVMPGPADGGSIVELTLEYELGSGGPLRGLSDALFIRRALRDALRRTLRRFAVEAEEEAGLR